MMNVLVSFNGVAQGTLAVVSTAVADLTGQPPQSVSDYLFAHRAALIGETVNTAH